MAMVLGTKTSVLRSVVEPLARHLAAVQGVVVKGVRRAKRCYQTIQQDVRPGPPENVHPNDQQKYPKSILEG